MPSKVDLPCSILTFVLNQCTKEQEISIFPGHFQCSTIFWLAKQPNEQSSNSQSDNQPFLLATYWQNPVWLLRKVRIAEIIQVFNGFFSRLNIKLSFPGSPFGEKANHIDRHEKNYIQLSLSFLFSRFLSPQTRSQIYHNAWI